MFHSPIGGISFIANLLIILVGNLIKPLKPAGVSRQYIVTQDDIAKLEETRLGELFSRSIAYMMPVAILFTILVLCLGALYRLYNDQRKLTMLDIAQQGYAEGVNRLDGMTFPTKLFAFSEQTKAGSKVSASSPNTEEQAVVPDSTDLSTARAASNKVMTLDSAESSDTETIVPTGGEIQTPDSEREKVFKDAANEQNLIKFFEANGLDPTFRSREKFASFFGIIGYSGKKGENELLLKKLKELTIEESREMLAQ